MCSTIRALLFGYHGNILTMLQHIFRRHWSAQFPMLTARRFSEFDTSVICHAVFIFCLGSFLLVARYVLRLKVLFLQGQRLKYSHAVKIMLTLILYQLLYFGGVSNKTIIVSALVGYEMIAYSQLGLTGLVGYLPSHIQRALME